MPFVAATVPFAIVAWGHAIIRRGATAPRGVLELRATPFLHRPAPGETIRWTAVFHDAARHDLTTAAGTIWRPTVSAGGAVGVVTATGKDTELGHINQMMAGIEKHRTPLLVQMDKLGKAIFVIILAMMAALFVFSLMFREIPMGELLLSLISLAVASVPEGLPAIEEAIFAGVPINVTLLFSTEQYLAAAEAFMRGIERRIEAGLKPDITSVASIFVSRWDVAVANQVPEALKNRLGIAVAKLTYKASSIFCRSLAPWGSTSHQFSTLSHRSSRPNPR